MALYVQGLAIALVAVFLGGWGALHQDRDCLGLALVVAIVAAMHIFPIPTTRRHH